MNKTRHVCLIFGHDNKADRDRLSGALRYAAGRTCWETRILNSSSRRFGADCKGVFSGWQADGIVSSDRNAVETAITASKPSARIRVSLIDGMDPLGRYENYVNLDQAALTECALGLLVRRGYGTLAFFGTDVKDEREWSRHAERVMAERASRESVFAGAFRFSDTRPWTRELERVANWVAELPKPCGIVAYSDNLARLLLDACHFARISVPGQVAIIGIDDSSDICETTVPTLTSILPDFEASGYLAAELLERSFSSKRTKPVCRSYSVKRISERASTMDTRGGGRIVSAAQDLIRARALDPKFSVKALAHQLNVSTRLLELHYKRIVGRRLAATIHNVRLDAIRDRLLKTSSPIGEICGACGFRTANAAHVAFRKRYGQSMRDVRQTHGDAS